MVEVNATTLQKQQLCQLKYEVQTCIDNLRKYRGHLARHIAEEEKDIEEL